MTRRLGGIAFAFALSLFGPAAPARAQTAVAGPACPDGPADEREALVGGDLAAAPAVVQVVVDSVLRQMGYSVDSALSRPGQWVTRPRHVWPQADSVDRARWQGLANPGVEVLVDLEPQGAGSRLRVAAGMVCRLPAATDSVRARTVERNLEVLTATEVAGGIAGALQAP